nr:MAG TPA: hypothetical protein [Caudoviricetes sp.]
MADTLWGAYTGDGTQVVLIHPAGGDDMYVMSHDFEIFTAPREEITLTGKRYALQEVVS